MYSNIRYFKGLNALRFLAAYLVLIHHSEQIRLKNNLFNFKEYSFFNNGGLAVSFFFVLSGFLITYLLLKEIDERGLINIKYFYIRRILRIWPLYFLLVAIGTLLVPFLIQVFNVNYEMPYRFRDVFVYYILFSPFLVNLYFGHHLLEPLWSIGVEEIFYIFWAPLVKLFYQSIFLLSISVILLKVFLFLWLQEYYNSEFLISLVKILSFESMAIGAFGANYVYHLRKNINELKLFSKFFQFVFLIIIFARLLFFKTINIYFTSEISHYFLNLAFDFLFLWLIINLSLNDNSIIKLNHKLFNTLGDISYGIYMYHMVVIFSIIFIFSNYFTFKDNFFIWMAFYCLVTIITILVSYFSKKYFENEFLRLKKKY